MEMYLCICDGSTVSKALEVRLWGGQDLCELPEQDMDGRSGGPFAVPQARQPDGAGAIGLDVRMQDWGTELKAWGIERIVNREGDDERVVAVRPKRAGRTPHRALPFQRPARIGGSCKQPRWQDALLLLPSQHSRARHLCKPARADFLYKSPCVLHTQTVLIGGAGAVRIRVAARGCVNWTTRTVNCRNSYLEDLELY